MTSTTGPLGPPEQSVPLDAHAYDAASPEEALAADLHSAALHLLRALRQTDATLGISPARLSALSVIVFGGPLSLRDLAAAEQVTPPSMSRIVAALEATAEGRRVMFLGRERRVETLAARLRALAPADLESLARAVEVLKLLDDE